jgi:Na+/proline symporter
VKKIFAKPVKFIINCCGFEDLSLHSSSELILSLIINNICRTNASKQVLKLMKILRLIITFFIMGPLLAGNSNKK